MNITPSAHSESLEPLAQSGVGPIPTLNPARPANEEAPVARDTPRAPKNLTRRERLLEAYKFFVLSGR